MIDRDVFLRVDGFTEFLHGSAVLYPELTRKMPIWVGGNSHTKHTKVDIQYIRFVEPTAPDISRRRVRYPVHVEQARRGQQPQQEGHGLLQEQTRRGRCGGTTTASPRDFDMRKHTDGKGE